VSVGIPFPPGLVRESGDLALLDGSGNSVNLQTNPLARWPDGSIKWLLIDFVPHANTLAQGQHRLTRSLQSAPARHSPALRLTQPAGTILVETGSASFQIDERTGILPSRVVLDGQDILQPGSACLRFTDARGREVAPRIREVAVEAAGPVRATIRCVGVIPGRRPLRFVSRLCFFSGTGLVRVRLTIHNPNRARHRGGLWDLGDPGSCFFRDLALEMRTPAAQPCEVSWIAEAGDGQSARKATSLEIYQDSSGGENWQSANHVNADGNVPCSFRGYRVRADGRESFGLRASPVIAVRGSAGAVTVAVPGFWQQFPKALEADENCVRARLFPKQFADRFELQGGEQKTHTVWLNFTSSDQGLSSLHWVHEPTRVRATPEWYARSQAIPCFAAPGLNDDPRLATLMAEATRGEKSLVARREIIDEYGWRHFGEVYADHEAAYYQGTPPVISHYNNQYDVIYGAIVQFLRTGDPAWSAVLEPLARHVIDIDIYHTSRDRAAYNGGLFWLTDHYKTAATCTHRTYSRANCRRGDRSYGGGPGATNNYTTGLLHYYYLTGDPLAAEAVISLARWVIDMDDGQKNVLGIIDDGPSGLASKTGGTEYHGPGRGCGNSVNALLDAWLLTGTRSYLDEAEQLIRRTIHPDDDLTSDHLLNAEDYFSYTVFLSVLCRYLVLKEQASEMDRAYVYARASLMTWARWMAERERPYFDRPEELEYPTETWAAHEMRKANVMRMVAVWAGEGLGTRLRERGHAFAERAWSDLMAFPSRAVARAIALMAVEGARDGYFRTTVAPAAPPCASRQSFETPLRFVSQKVRVFQQVKTPSGIVRALCRLADGRRWWRFWRARYG
jgi:hypothetical protein